MLTLHHLEYSQSFRILWLLEAMGIDYELKIYKRDPKTSLAPDDYKKLSPLGTAPVITDGDIVLAETNTIIDYLLDKFPNEQLRPGTNSPHYLQHLFWFHGAQGSLSPLLLMDSIFRIIQARVPFFMKPFVKLALGKATKAFVMPRLRALMELAESDLKKSPWFGGNQFTAADIVLSFSMESAAHKGLITDDYPNCQAWLERMREEPAFRRAREKDGRDTIVFAF